MVEAFKTQRFLVHFLKRFEYLDFCLNELESLSEMFGVPRDKLYAQDRGSINMKRNPTVYVNLPNENIANKIVNRSILISSIIDVRLKGIFIIQVISESKNYEQMLENVDKSKLFPILEVQKKFKFLIEGVGKKISIDQQRKIIDSFSIFPFEPKIDLENPEVIFSIVDIKETGDIYFGRQVANRRISKEDDTFHSRFSLKKRPYLGPTSTDHELAFLMANQGQVKEGDFIFDPFVGTGSIALACSYFKCFQFGGDLDIRVLKGYGVGRKTKNQIEGLDKIKRFDIFTNFNYLGVPQPEILIMDNSRSFIVNEQRRIFDAIVCDPPYGVRARSQKVGIKESKKIKPKKEDNKEENNEEEEQEPHYSMKEHYEVSTVYQDLLCNASKMLKKGGRIVFLYHTDTSLPDEKNKFPEHPDFEFLCSSKDDLTKCRARHLITMIRK